MIQDGKLRPVKVLIVDDSAFSRQTIKRILEKTPKAEVIGVATDGRDGMEKIIRLNPDVITLDLEMPEMDGFALLRWLMKERPLPVIVVSSYGDKPTVFKALELGAVDFVVKPSKKASLELKDIENDLLNKIFEISSLDIKKVKKNISLLENKKVIEDDASLKDSKIDVVAIGSSTGGPTAIQSIITRLPANFSGGIVISQHMPPGFTKQFANRIDSISLLNVKEAENGEPVERGKVLICPGGNHMVFEKSKNDVFVVIKNSSSNDRYIPSVDIMMKSVACIYGARTMGIILTGMGNDGKQGMQEIRKREGFTIAESEESSVVFGMPREVILSCGVNKVLSLGEIPAEILRKIKMEY